MPLWVMKAALQHVIGRLPKSYWWNALFQKYVTKGYLPSRESFEAKLECCRQHLDHYLRFSPAPRLGFRALELGTGSWPIVPLGLYLCGASEIWTYDLVPLVRRDTLKRTLELFSEVKREGALERLMGTVEEERFLRLEALLDDVEKETPVQLLGRLNIHVRIGDARTNTLPDKFADLVFSTVVLEMVDAEILSGLLAEFSRVASPDSVMSHYVGLGDQYASSGSSITMYNFLQYSDRMWCILNNPIIPHSRLRLPDYRELFKRNGWDIVEERNRPGSLDDFKKIKLAPKFRQYSTEELLILYSWLVARPLLKN